MRRLHKTLIFCASIATTALCALPLMSTHLSGGESCTMVIRGFNLMEFSARGCVPLFAALLIPMILFGCQSKTSKEAELLLLVVINLTCFVHGINASHEWIHSLNGSLLTYYSGMMIYPCAFIATWVLAWICNRGGENKTGFGKYEEALNEQSGVFLP